MYKGVVKTLKTFFTFCQHRLNQRIRHLYSLLYLNANALYPPLFQFTRIPSSVVHVHPGNPPHLYLYFLPSTTAWDRIPNRACEKVTSDMGLGGGFRQALKFLHQLQLARPELG